MKVVCISCICRRRVCYLCMKGFLVWARSLTKPMFCRNPVFYCLTKMKHMFVCANVSDIGRIFLITCNREYRYESIYSCQRTSPYLHDTQSIRVMYMWAMCLAYVDVSWKGQNVSVSTMCDIRIFVSRIGQKAGSWKIPICNHFFKPSLIYPTHVAPTTSADVISRDPVIPFTRQANETMLPRIM